ncbi:MAG: hypothetical protein QOI49_2657, partial [Verrucomicrobiota bacterium]
MSGDHRKKKVRRRYSDQARPSGGQAGARSCAQTPVSDRVGDQGEVVHGSIPQDCVVITPQMLPLVKLTSVEIEKITSAVPGGPRNVQDIYPLAPVQEGMLFHHRVATRGDPYLRASLGSFDTRVRMDRYLQALQAVVDRHDILRTAILWEELSQPVQVVWRVATLPIEEVALNGTVGDSTEQLLARFNPRQIRLDVREAPMLRIKIARAGTDGRWFVLMLFHHLAYDGVTLEIMKSEVRAHLLGKTDQLPTPRSFRNFVADVRLGVSEGKLEAFFRQMLRDVEEPTAPFGLLEVLGDGSDLREAHCEVNRDLIRRLRERASKLGMSVTRLYHLAWGQVLARVSGSSDVIFGTMLSGRTRPALGENNAGLMMGPAINIVPIRLQVGNLPVETSVRDTHALLTSLSRNKHASLALTRRCSAVAASTPLFSALFNYRRRPDSFEAAEIESVQEWKGIEGIYGGLTNYPLALAVDELDERSLLTAQVQTPIEPMRVCNMMHTALERLVEALERAPHTPICDLDVLP